MFDLVVRSNRDELCQRLQSIIGNLDATATFKDGLTDLSAYMMFVLHYFENHLTTANLHNYWAPSQGTVGKQSALSAYVFAGGKRICL